MCRLLRWSFLALGVAIAASTANAHAKLVQSAPPAKSTITSPPHEIRLTFNEPVAVKLSGIDLTSSEGSKIVTVGAAAAVGDKNVLVVTVKDMLPPGTYQFHCSLHSWMKGVLQVTPAGGGGVPSEPRVGGGGAGSPTAGSALAPNPYDIWSHAAQSLAWHSFHSTPCGRVVMAKG